MKGDLILEDLLKYKLFFGNIISFGSATMEQLLDICGNEEDIYGLSEKAIESMPITVKQKEEFIKAKSAYDLSKLLDNLYRLKMNFVTMDMPDYPLKLRDIPNKPYQLFYYGKLPDSFPSVAIIGARNCSQYGIDMAAYYAKELSYEGVQIISGMASGIDGVSQRTALKENGQTYGILGSGVDVCYPRSNFELYDMLKEKGGIISEYPPGTKPLAMYFPMRNRIISGLSDIVLVIEARERSGTAITVNMALEQGKDVYAVPGRNTDPLSAGCNQMIAQGAGVALGAEGILDALDYLMQTKKEERITTIKKFVDDNNKTRKFDEGLKNVLDNCANGKEKTVLNLLLHKSFYVDELFEKIDEISFEELKITLFSMEMKGLLCNKAGLYSAILEL